jgi:integrase
VYALRFRAYGRRRYLTLGTAADGWSRARAEDELANVLADVRRGIWRAPDPPPRVDEPRPEPTFHEFASEWFAARETEGLAAKTLTDLRWSLTNHLLPFFAGHRLSEITVQEVDRYKAAKVRERQAIDAAREQARARGVAYGARGLSNASINHTLRHLAQVLETAVEYAPGSGWTIQSNPAAGKRRRVRPERPSRPWVEPEQLVAFLEASSGVGRLLLALLAGSGLRIGEALALRWRHVDLGTGTLHVEASKTEKGVRRVDLSPALREELALWRAGAAYTRPTDHVIHTRTGRRHNESNLRRDVLAPAVERANARLAEEGIAPIPPITFHSLRRTYATVQRFLEPADYVADQLGHEDSRFTDRVYRQTAKNRRDRLAPAHREAFDRALEWAQIGPSDWAPTGTSESVEAAPLRAEATKNPA